MNVRLPSLSTTARTLALLVAAWCAGVPSLLLGQPSAPAPLTLLSSTGRRAIPITAIGTQEFVALDDLATLFQLTVREEGLGAVTVSYKNKTIVLTADQALASVSGRLVSLPAAPSRSGRRWFVPVEFISRALVLVYDTRLDLRKASRLLVVGALRVPHLTARYDLLGSAARLTIDATPGAASTIVQTADRLTIKFDADALDIEEPLLQPLGPQALVQTVRVLDATTIEVTVGPHFAGFRASTQPVDTTMRLVVDLASTQAENTPSSVAPPVPELPPAFGSPASTVRTIAIDPGHGGEDDGVKSADGTKEKDVTLAVARRAKAMIEGRLGIRVLLTRDDDHAVAIDDRTAVANNNKADLLVSLHVNGALRPSVSGASIYYAAFDAEAAKAVGAAKPERVATFGGGARDIELVPWDMAQIRHVEQSVAFANLLEQHFRGKVPLTPRPVDGVPLRVLASANIDRKSVV